LLDGCRKKSNLASEETAWAAALGVRPWRTQTPRGASGTSAPQR
jgi:hypothetical protein